MNDRKEGEKVREIKEGSQKERSLKERRNNGRECSDPG